MTELRFYPSVLNCAKYFYEVVVLNLQYIKNMTIHHMYLFLT